jgi:hypothetical protein
MKLLTRAIMTGQMADMLSYKGESYYFTGLMGNELIQPEDLGLEPYKTCTACYRGYVLFYTIKENKLLLNSMLINDKNGPTINGINPDSTVTLFKQTYADLNIKVDFTGKILVGKDLIEGMYEHGGFQAPIAFSKLLEFTIENGIVSSMGDISEIMNEYRLLGQDQKEEVDREHFNQILDWLDGKNWV